MAYVAKPEEEDAKPADNPLLAGFGAAPAPAAGTAPAAAPGAPAPASSNFVPYSAYEQANRGGAQKMASDIAGDVGAKAQAAQTGTAAAQEAFRGQVTAGNPYAVAAPQGSSIAEKWAGLGGQLSQPAEPAAPGAPAAPALKTVQAAPKRGASPIGQLGYTDIGLGYTKAGGGAPVYSGGITPEEARANSTKKYTGPTAIDSVAGWGALGGQTQAAQDALRNTGTEEGRQALVQQKYGSSGGNSRLDAALTGSAGGGQFDALRAKYGDLVGERARVAGSSNQFATDTARGVAGTSGTYGQEIADYDRLQAAPKAEADAIAQNAVADAKARGEWPPRTPAAVDAAVSAVGAAGGPLGIAASVVMRLAIEAELARERDVIAHPEKYKADSTATIKTSGTKLPGTRD